MSKELAMLSPHRIAELAERFDGRANIAHINKHFRYQDESHKWPIQGMFNATERAIRRLRRNPPPPAQKLRVVHGDYRTGNFMHDGAGKIIALLDWRLDPQQAVDLANFGSRNGPTEVERGTEAEGWMTTLQARGHEVRAIEMTSGIQAIVVSPIGYLGGADTRREGVAIGD
jgi:thiamine kinase-like enzyme